MCFVCPAAFSAACFHLCLSPKANWITGRKEYFAEHSSPYLQHIKPASYPFCWGGKGVVCYPVGLVLLPVFPFPRGWALCGSSPPVSQVAHAGAGGGRLGGSGATCDGWRALRGGGQPKPALSWGSRSSSSQTQNWAASVVLLEVPFPCWSSCSSLLPQLLTCSFLPLAQCSEGSSPPSVIHKWLLCTFQLQGEIRSFAPPRAGLQDPSEQLTPLAVCTATMGTHCWPHTGLGWGRVQSSHGCLCSVVLVCPVFIPCRQKARGGAVSPCMLVQCVAEGKSCLGSPCSAKARVVSWMREQWCPLEQPGQEGDTQKRATREVWGRVQLCDASNKPSRGYGLQPHLGGWFLWNSCAQASHPHLPTAASELLSQQWSHQPVHLVCCGHSPWLPPTCRFAARC